MANKVGPLIKEARTEAGLTQEQLAKKINGISANDISKAERGELELTQTVLKEIAKITGVTQSSLINAAKNSTYKTSAKTASAKKTSSGSTSVKVTASEKKLLELYRDADSDTKKAAVSLLKGESTGIGDIIGSLLGKSSSSGKSELLDTLLDTAKDALGKK
jgi:transcriptional regulator with XRE-family HTH domain